MYELPTAPQNARGLIDAAFELFKASFGALLPLTAITTVLGYAPLVWLLYSNALEDPYLLLDFVFSPRVAAALAVLACLSVIVYAAMLVRVDAVAKHLPMSALGALAASARRSAPLIVASLVYAFVVTIGFLLVIPGLVLAQSLIFYLPAIALDGLSPLDSLTWSHRLVWGHWWMTAGVFGLGLLIASLVVYAGGAIGLLLLEHPLVALAVQAFTSLVAAQFMIALWLVLFRDLELRKGPAAGPAL